MIPFSPRGVEPNSERADVDLVAAIANDDRQALGLLYDRYHTQVFAFIASAFSFGDDEVGDVVQDTFLAVLGSSKRFSGTSSVKTWLFGIAVNTARNRYRNEKRRRNRHVAKHDLERHPPEQENQLQNRRDLARMSAAIAELKPELRLAYVACVLEELPAADASAVLGVRKGTLWRRVHEARAHIRTVMERDIP